MGPWGSLGACRLGVPVTRVQRSSFLWGGWKSRRPHPQELRGDVMEKTEEVDVEKETLEGLLVPFDRYVSSGIHIGTKLKTGYSSKFIAKKRKDDIYVFDIKKIDERIRLAANLLKKYKPEEILIVATRFYAGNAAKKLQSFIKGVNVITGRFVPGTLTNPEQKGFMEPSIILVCDPMGEKEALREAGEMNIPTIVLMDTENSPYSADLVVPMNNKGRKSLALFFWLLTRELLLAQGQIKDYGEFKTPITYFEKVELEEGNE